jgi:FkbM family methyltransferase
MSYSQYDEEKYILEAVSHIDTGRFLDIGAWHPTCFSNTRALYEKGWSGVMLEPSPEPMLSLIREYGNDPHIQLVQACVTPGDAAKLVKLTITADSVSTTVPSHAAKWQSTGGYYGSILVPTISLNQTLGFDHFDFVNIDAEGISADLFVRLVKHFPLRPCACICVEHDDRLDELNHLAALHGYQLRYANGTNAVFGRAK